MPGSHSSIESFRSMLCKSQKKLVASRFDRNSTLNLNNVLIDMKNNLYSLLAGALIGSMFFATGCQNAAVYRSHQQ